jgi:hypothetical protein
MNYPRSKLWVSEKQDENYPKASPPNVFIVVRLCSPRP